MSEQEIHDAMMEIGRKYSTLAKNAESVKHARGAMDLAERAFRLALLAKKEIRKGNLVDFNHAFMSTLGEKMLRSQVWIQYNTFCLDHDLIPVTKGELFEKLKQLGFTFKKHSGGDYYVHSPLKQPQILIEAAARFSAD